MRRDACAVGGNTARKTYCPHCASYGRAPAAPATFITPGSAALVGARVADLSALPHSTDMTDTVDMTSSMPNGPTLPHRMRAAYIQRFGPADEIRVGEFPLPAVGRDEVLVRVTAVAVNPIDTYIRAGTYHVTVPFPFIIGRDLVGEVVRVGELVTHLAPGQRVWCNSLGYEGRQGSFAEYAVVAQERLYPLPGHVDPLQAVATFHPAATAFLGLVSRGGGVHPGQVELVGGGAGNVGSAVVQLAVAMGARVLTTAHGTEDAAWCRACGAAEVYDYRDPDLATKVRDAAPNGVDVVWNTSGHDNLDRAVDLLAHGGCLVLMAGLEQRPPFPVGPFYTKNARAIGFTITAAATTELTAAAAMINTMLATGTLKTRIAQVLPLSDARLAHQLVEGSIPSGEKIKGRVVVIMPGAARANMQGREQ